MKRQKTKKFNRIKTDKEKENHSICSKFKLIEGQIRISPGNIPEQKHQLCRDKQG